MATPVVWILERLARQPTAPMHDHTVFQGTRTIAPGFGAQVGTWELEDFRVVAGLSSKSRG